MAKDINKFHERVGRTVGNRNFRDLMEELDTNPQAREEAKKNAKAFVKQRVPELPDEATIEVGEGSFYIKLCGWGVCITIEW